MVKTRWFIFAFLFISTVPACGNGYRGDGYLSYNWFAIGAYAVRYKLNLGCIELNRITTYSYTMTNLPNERFTLGLEIAAKRYTQKPLLDSRPLNPIVRVHLSNSSGVTVIDETAELKKWIWSGSSDRLNESFVYRAGISRLKQAGDNKFTQEYTGVLGDEGWGTYFTPKRNERYNLQIEIIHADRDAVDYDIRLIAKA